MQHNPESKKKKGKRRIRSSSKAREAYQKFQSNTKYTSVADITQAITEKLELAKITLDLIMHRQDDQEIIRLYILFNDILLDLDALDQKQHEENAPIFVNRTQLIGFLLLLKDVVDLATKMRYETRLFSITHLHIEDDQVIFFNPLHRSLIHTLAILNNLMKRAFYKDSMEKTMLQSAEQQIKPYVIECACCLQVFEGLYERIVRSDVNSAQEKDESETYDVVSAMKERMGFIDEQIAQLNQSDKLYKEFLAYQSALNADWEMSRPVPNKAKALEHYKRINALLGSQIPSLSGLSNLLVKICLKISDTFSQDELQDIVFRLFWQKRAWNWATPAQRSFINLDAIIEESNAALANRYRKDLLSSELYERCDPYFQISINPDKPVLEIQCTYSTSKAHFRRLKKLLRDAKVVFDDDDENQIIKLDCAHHYFPPARLLHILSQHAEQLEIISARLPYQDDATSVEAPPVATSEYKEKEKEKEKDASSSKSEKTEKARRHLEKEALRKEQKRWEAEQGESSKLAEKVEKESEETPEPDEEYVLKVALPGKKQMAFYHLSLDDSIAKKISNQRALEKAEEIIRQPTRSFGSQGLIFFKSGKSKTRLVKMKIGGEDARLFAKVVKSHKDSQGRKHYTVSFDTVEKKHRKKS